MEGTQLHYQEQTGCVSIIKRALGTGILSIETYFLKKVATCLRSVTAKNWAGWLFEVTSQNHKVCFLSKWLSSVLI